MSDSEDDDDDLLLTTSTFKKSRKEEAQKVKNNNCLDQFIKEETKRNEIKIQSDLLETTTDDNYWDRVRNAVKDEGNDNDMNDNGGIDEDFNHQNDDTMLFDAQKRVKDNAVVGSGSGGLYLMIGLRNMFVPTDQNMKYNNIQIFSSNSEIITKLSALRSPWGKGIYNKIDCNDTPKRNTRVKKANKADEKNPIDILCTLLYRKDIVKAIEKNTDVKLSRDIFDWLWSISCSSDNNTNNIPTFLIKGSYKTLADLIRMNACRSFVHSIEDLHNGLHHLFGLLPDNDIENNHDYSDTYDSKIEGIRTEGMIKHILACLLRRYYLFYQIYFRNQQDFIIS